MSKDLATRLEALDAKKLLKVLALIVAFSIAATVVTFSAYFMQFGGSFSTDRAVWGQFGEFIGGSLSPLLSFFALLALVLTLVLQSRQLEYAREELEGSRKELAVTLEQLERSADAQAKTAAALTEQAKFSAIGARLSALSAALTVTSEVVSQMQGRPLPQGFDYQALVHRKEDLAGKILKITDELCNGANEPS
ncbi:hypothetical protein ACFFJT_13090 [Dyella flava]|uniref:Uncharacterized protein n=1 Tax=Dyella flava TaxID=1920170 RepID=A0ABS2JZH0_9GAMM|nr:hypothetical protein [Dyella flava]MBM7124402.1 hypothetical protein [Dyella flava]GLQ52489.1 hypothetical protein GCM10010872_39380 [Dyella flava]